MNGEQLERTLGRILEGIDNLKDGQIELRRAIFDPKGGIESRVRTNERAVAQIKTIAAIISSLAGFIGAVMAMAVSYIWNSLRGQ